MLKKKKKIPGGTLLVPMLLAALFNTFFPELFMTGGISEALFTPKGTNYIVGLVCFCSATSIDLKKLIHVSSHVVLVVDSEQKASTAQKRRCVTRGSSETSVNPAWR